MVFITDPSHDAMRLVMHEFAVLRKKLKDEIEQVRVQGLFTDDGAQFVREPLLQMARMLELTHLSRTAPVSGNPRLDWKRERFLRSLPSEERSELEYTDPEFTLKDSYDDKAPWREVAGWLLGNIVSPELSTAWTTCNLACRISGSEKLESLQEDMEGSAYFYSPDGDNRSWITLIREMAWHHICIIQRSDGLGEGPLLVTSADYDTINASFDAIPEYNYAAKVAGGSVNCSLDLADAAKASNKNNSPEPEGDDERKPSQAFWDDASGSQKAMMRLLLNSPECRIKARKMESTHQCFSVLKPSTGTVTRALNRLNQRLMETSPGWYVERSNNLASRDAEIWLVAPKSCQK